MKSDSINLIRVLFLIPSFKLDKLATLLQGNNTTECYQISVKKLAKDSQNAENTSKTLKTAKTLPK